jgi:hypothetical protein
MMLSQPRRNEVVAWRSKSGIGRGDIRGTPHPKIRNHQDQRCGLRYPDPPLSGWSGNRKLGDAGRASRWTTSQLTGCPSLRSYSATAWFVVKSFPLIFIHPQGGIHANAFLLRAGVQGGRVPDGELLLAKIISPTKANHGKNCIRVSRL